MQLIIENSDQFDQDVVDDALIDLNSQMHVPIMDEDEVDVLANKEPSTVDQVGNSINSSNEETVQTANEGKTKKIGEEDNSISSIEDLISNPSKNDGDSLV